MLIPKLKKPKGAAPVEFLPNPRPLNCLVKYGNGNFIPATFGVNRLTGACQFFDARGYHLKQPDAFRPATPEEISLYLAGVNDSLLLTGVNEK